MIRNGTRTNLFLKHSKKFHAEWGGMEKDTTWLHGGFSI